MGPYGMGFPSPGFEDHGWKYYIITLVMIIAAGLTVVARLFTRYYYAAFGWDDAVVTIGLVFAVGMCIAILMSIEYGYGAHIKQLSTANRDMALKLFYIAQTPYKVTICCNKVSVILFYLRIFPTKSFRIACFVVMAIIVIWSLGAIFATIFQCIPIAASWNNKIPGKCVNSDATWISYAVINIITDVMVLALPIPLILRLHLSLRERLLLCGVFLMGSFVTAASIVRVTSVSNSLKNVSDKTYNFVTRGIWTTLEANLGIISACLPILKKPLGRIFPLLFGSTKATSHHYGGTGGITGASGPGTSKEARRGYILADLSSSQPSAHGYWRDQEPKSHHAVSVSRADVDADNMSDERQIIGGSMGESGSEHELTDGIVVSKRFEVRANKGY